MTNAEKYLNLNDVQKVLPDGYELETLFNVMASIYDELSKEEQKYVDESLEELDNIQTNTLNMLTEQEIKEIIKNSNHKSLGTIQDCYNDGILEIYSDYDEFEFAGDKQDTIQLSTGKVIYFIGG